MTLSSALTVSSLTVDQWIKTDHVNPSGILQNQWVNNITGGAGFFKYNELFGMGLDNGRLSNYVANTSGATGFALSTNPLNDDTWHHCFLTFDGSTLRSYIDGSLNVTIEGITSWGSSTLNTMGRYYTSTIRYFNGEIGSLRVYNRALSANEALHNYNALKGRFS